MIFLKRRAVVLRDESELLSEAILSACLRLIHLLRLLLLGFLYFCKHVCYLFTSLKKSSMKREI